MKLIDQKLLIETYRHYFEFRGMHWPDDAHEAVDFAVTEVAEALDAVMRQDAKWVRHNNRDRDLGMEISQAVMMLAIAADADGIDIVEATFSWMRSKGFEPELWTGKDYVLWGYATENSNHSHLWGIFGSKKNRFFQSACGLEFPGDHTLHKVFVNSFPKSDSRCGQCDVYWQSRRPSKTRDWAKEIRRFFRRG